MHSLPAGSVVITPNDMFAEMRAIHDQVRDLAGKVDPALAELRRDVAEAKTERSTIELRVRALENWRWFMAGLSAAAGATAGYAAAALGVHP